MGGMFDPVHQGHIAASLAAINALCLDEVRLIPCHLPNHRGPAQASNEARLAMLELAASIDERLIVDDRECRSSSISYTVSTLESLRADYANAILVLIMGDDAFAGLGKWHRWQAIFELAHVLVVSRPGAESELSPELVQLLLEREADRAEEMMQTQHGRILRLHDLNIDVSSSAVRCELRDGHKKVTQRQLAPSVAAYIEKHQLYSGRECSA